MALVGLFLTQKTAFAEDLEISNYTSGYGIDYSDNYYTRFVFQSFTPIFDFSLSKLGVNYYRAWSFSGYSWFNLKDASGQILATSTLLSSAEMAGKENTFIYYNFSPYPLVASTTYYLVAANDSHDVYGQLMLNSSQVGSSYPNGCGGGSLYSVFPDCAPSPYSIFDLAFEIWGNPQPIIAIEYPANESTIPDFLSFELSFNTLAPIISTRMCYGTSQSAVGDCLNSTSTWPLLAFDTGGWSNYLPGTSQYQILPKTRALTASTTYYGKAYLFEYYNIYLAESPEMAWNTEGFWVPATSTVSSTLGIAGDWTGLLNLIKMKPPVGYFYSGINAWGGLNASGTPAVSLPSYGPIQTYIFTPIRTGLIFILWLIFGVWIFHRFRHIEL